MPAKYYLPGSFYIPHRTTPMYRADHDQTKNTPLDDAFQFKHTLLIDALESSGLLSKPIIRLIISGHLLQNNISPEILKSINKCGSSDLLFLLKFGNINENTLYTILNNNISPETIAFAYQWFDLEFPIFEKEYKLLLHKINAMPVMFPSFYDKSVVLANKKSLIGLVNKIISRNAILQTTKHPTKDQWTRTILRIV